MNDKKNVFSQVEDAYPLTSLQAGMVFHSEYNNDAIYHDIFTYHLKGEYDFNLLKESLQEVVLRHPVLRTGINLSGFSQPLQFVYKDADVEILEETYAAHSEEERKIALQSWVAKEKLRFFDWSVPPLFRIKVHNWGENLYSISLSFHHCILDGWSVSALMMELVENYIAKLDGHAFVKKPCPLKFCDYVAQEKAASDSEEFKEFWQNYLKGRSWDKIPRWSDGSFIEGYRSKKVDVSKELSNKLLNLAKKLSLPIKHVLLSAHMSVLSFITGKTDVVTGLVSNGRMEQAGSEEVLGLFLNVLPFRLDVGSKKWRDLIQSSFQNEKEMLPYRFFPQYEIKKKVAPDMEFDAMFNYIHFQVSESVFSNGSKVKFMGHDAYEQTNYPLLFQCSYDALGQKIDAELIYDGGIFPQEQMAYISNRYLEALKEICENVDGVYFDENVKEYADNNFSFPVKSLEMPGAKKNDLNKSFSKASLAIDLPLPRIKRYIQKSEMDIISFIISSLNAFLYKYTGKDEILMGISADHSKLKERYKLQSESLLNGGTKFFSSKIINSMTFSDFFELSKDGYETAAEMQDGRFYDYIINKIKTLSANSSNHDFEVMVSIADNTTHSIKETFGLLFSFVLKGDSLTAAIEYDKNIFDESDIRRIGENYRYSIEQLADKEDLTLEELDVVSTAEKELILNEYNHKTAAIPNKSITELFEEQAEKTPDNVAITFGEETVTYKRLNNMANQIAQKLRNLGVKPNDFVALLFDRSIDMIAAIIGTIKSGAAYVPIDPNYPEDRIKYTIDDCAPKAVLIGRNDFDIDVNAPIIRYGELEFADADTPNPEIVNSKDDLLYIIYTSGTTGRPKGVMIRHSNLLSLLKCDGIQFDFNDKDVWLLFHSYCFDVSVWEIFGAFLYGGNLIVIPQDEIRDAEAVLKAIDKNNVTVLTQVPSAFFNLMRMDNDTKLHLKSLRYLVFAGEALYPSKLVDFYNRYSHVCIVNMYGTTETTVHSSYREIGKNEIQRGVSDIGQGIPTIQFYIMNGQELCGIQMPGEICIAGSGVGKGYLNRPELSNEKFIDNPFGEGKMYRSGDLARWMPDGNIEYLGRIDHQVKIRGFRVELGEIENVIRQIEPVEDVVVLAKQINDDTEEKSLTAYIVLKSSISADEIKTQIGEKLPYYMMPAFYIFIDKIPLTYNGKINREELLSLEVSIDREACEYVAPQTQAEKDLAEIFSKVLARSNIGVKDNFFDLGGDSIKSISIIAQAKDLGYALKVEDIFKYPTIFELAKRMLEATEEQNQEEEKISAFDLLSEDDRKKLLG